MRKEHAPPFFAPISGPARNGKQGRCAHTCYFCVAEGPQKCLLGSSPNPPDFWTLCPEVLVVCGPALSLLGLIPLVRMSEQMVDVPLDGHGLPHIRLGLAVFRVKGFFLFRQFPPLLFQRVHFGELRPV